MNPRAIIGFVIAFFAIGIPWWSMPYLQIEPTSPAIVPGEMLLVLLTAWAAAQPGASLRGVLALMGMVLPLVDIVSIIHDTAIDPTTHNLAPIEVVMMAVFGLMMVVPGLILGLLARRVIIHIGR